MAPMPTASTAQILGNNESIEVYTSNIYTRRVLSGEFQVTLELGNLKYRSFCYISYDWSKWKVSLLAIILWNQGLLLLICWIHQIMQSICACVLSPLFLEKKKQAF